MLGARWKAGGEQDGDRRCAALEGEGVPVLEVVGEVPVLPPARSKTDHEKRISAVTWSVRLVVSGVSGPPPFPTLGSSMWILLPLPSSFWSFGQDQVAVPTDSFITPPGKVSPSAVTTSQDWVVKDIAVMWRDSKCGFTFDQISFQQNWAKLLASLCNKKP